MTRELDLTADVIDVRDIIARWEAIEEQIFDFIGEHEAETDEEKRDAWDKAHPKLSDEYAVLSDALDDLRGNGGDEQWRGDWYPVTLIRDSYFQRYAEELCEDIGDVPRDMPSYLVIDWEATARNVRMDYTSTEIDGVTYWYR